MREYVNRSMQIMLLLVPFMSCKNTAAIHLLVPSDYKGPVQITCMTIGDPTSSIVVDEQGNGIAPACPTDKTRVYVDRSGSSSEADGVQWFKTGDGITTGFEVDAK